MLPKILAIFKPIVISEKNDGGINEEQEKRGEGNKPTLQRILTCFGYF